jgi:glycerol-3-phosphate acyltransferase PlsY
MFFSILGHLFSPYLGFAGGKGIATSAGAFAALAPWAFLGAFIVFALVFGVWRIVSLGSLCAALSLPAFVALCAHAGLSQFDWTIEGVSILIMLVVIFKHRSNIQRLLAGTEKKLARVKPGEKS